MPRFSACFEAQLSGFEKVVYSPDCKMELWVLALQPWVASKEPWEATCAAAKAGLVQHHIWNRDRAFDIVAASN